jgi:hypothetical protein
MLHLKLSKAVSWCWLSTLYVGLFTVDARSVHDVRTEARASPLAWEEYWASHGVAPPPPRDFLEGRLMPAVQNLTGGRVSDETAAQWVGGDLRRGQGDNWAVTHMRLDLINADVLGPPGLNGSSRFVETERDKGVVELRFPPTSKVVAAGVLAVSKDLQLKYPGAGLTDYVLVLVYRSSGGGPERIYANGHSEPMSDMRPPAGELRWQLDTGDYRDNPVVGPLWYQQRGWSCRPGDGTVTGALCALVKANP